MPFLRDIVNDIDAALISSQMEIEDLQRERDRLQEEVSRLRQALEWVQEECCLMANSWMTKYFPVKALQESLRKTAAVAAEALKHG